MLTFVFLEKTKMYDTGSLLVGFLHLSFYISIHIHVCKVTSVTIRYCFVYQLARDEKFQ